MKGKIISLVSLLSLAFSVNLFADDVEYPEPVKQQSKTDEQQRDEEGELKETKTSLNSGEGDIDVILSSIIYSP